MTSPSRRLTVLAALAAVTLLQGCSSFRSTRRVDIGPFSDNTMHMVAEIDPGEGAQKVLFTRPYFPVPAARELRRAWDDMQALLRAVVTYSSEVVAVGQSSHPERRKVDQLARTVEQFGRAGAARGAEGLVRPAELDAIVAELRTQETFLAALGVAHRLVERTVDLAAADAGRIKTQQALMAGELGGKIDAAYGGIIANLQEIEALQTHAMKSLTLLVRVRLQTPGALEELRAHDAAVREALGTGPAPGAAALNAAGALVDARLAQLRTAREQIGPEVELYVRTKAELNTIVGLSDDHARRARLAVLRWARFHRNLADGLSIPPDIDVLGLARVAAGSAVGSVLP